MATSAAEHPAAPSRWRGLAPRALAVDLLLWLAATGPMLGTPLAEDGTFGWWDGLAAAAGLGLVILRRSWPIPTLAVGLAAVLIANGALGRPTALLPVSVILLFEVALRSDRATTIRAGVAGVVVTLSCIAMLVSNDFFGPELLAGLAWPTLAVTAGDAVRSRREAIAAAEERVARAEASREEEARRRVVEERLHIARELHDVVAHQIAVINVQAGVASHLVREDPDAAEAALATARSSAQQVLEELGGLLGVLRAEGDEPDATAPAPQLTDLDGLITSFEGTGLRIDLHQRGEAGPLPPTASLAAYRVVQEALTNAHKHGAGDVHVRLAHGPAGVEIEISNPMRADGPANGSASGTAFGLRGMRERVQAVGGTLDTGAAPDGTFRVRAVLPRLRTGQAP